MPDYAGKTVAEILRTKRAKIKYASLEPGSPSWADIIHMTWEEIEDGARRDEPGFRTIRKLLTKGRYNK